MVDRVILGQRNGAYGLWVSKATKDVKTAGDGDMLFSMQGNIQRVIAAGNWLVSGSPNTSTLSIPNPNSEITHVKLFIFSAYDQNQTDPVAAYNSGTSAGYFTELTDIQYVYSNGSTTYYWRWYATPTTITFEHSSGAFTNNQLLRYVVLSGF